MTPGQTSKISDDSMGMEGAILQPNRDSRQLGMSKNQVLGKPVENLPVICEP